MKGMNAVRPSSPQLLIEKLCCLVRHDRTILGCPIIMDCCYLCHNFDCFKVVISLISSHKYIGFPTQCKCSCKYPHQDTSCRYCQSSLTLCWCSTYHCPWHRFNIQSHLCQYMCKVWEFQFVIPWSQQTDCLASQLWYEIPDQPLTSHWWVQLQPIIRVSSCVCVLFDPMTAKIPSDNTQDYNDYNVPRVSFSWIISFCF